MQLLVQLRWLAVIGQVVTISLVHYGFGIPLPLPQMALVLLTLVLTNLGYIYWCRSHRRPISGHILFVALLLDVGALTIQLYLSGGTSNPFVYLFLLQGILGAVMLRPVYTWCLVGITVFNALGLALVNRPLQVDMKTAHDLSGLYVAGVLISFSLTAVLLVVFLTRIVANLRRRDARVAGMRQRATEQEHIVRMGLLATGAAHELGTPLATLSVILGDWQHMAQFNQDADLRQDLQEMQQQLLRCKSIVSGVLQSAGEARAETVEATTLLHFMDGLVANWRLHHSMAHLEYGHSLDADFPILSDTALQQMICNVLDNAMQASPDFVALHLAITQGQLLIRITDQGPGFAPGVLKQLGQRHVSTKTDRPERGLGMFLVFNTARALGASVRASNRIAAPGAQVEIRIPLSAIMLENPHHEPLSPAAAG